ncbi:hypothetical protein AB0F43_21785 [Kribbella sp. NPDC023972]|uniref:hypothetical protein n=1 Tax=Kribbella sp. NPDC023972 TaxID=3154795 RepID=UPI0033D50BD8
MTHQISADNHHRLAAEELIVLRARLHEDRLFRREQLREIAADVVGGACSSDLAAHREVREKLAAAARTALAETEAALARMDAGRYGNCGRCGRTISLDCLSAHPQARYCPQCLAGQE